MNDAEPIFTAAEIASVLGRKRQTVGDSLASIRETGTKFASGNEARAWSVAALPTSLREPLETLARQQGCRDAATLLRQSCEAWAPSIPLAQCHPDSVRLAEKLRSAMRSSFIRHRQGERGAAFESQGIEDYRREFGHAVGPRHWRELFTRTLKRAGTAHDPEKLELYLPEVPKRRITGPGIAQQKRDADSAAVVERLQSFIRSFGDPEKPTPREREALWTETMLALDAVLQGGVAYARAGRMVRAALFAVAPWISATPAALQKTFLRKLDAWSRTGGDARSMKDNRHERSGPDRFELPQADENVLLSLAVHHTHGHLARAWRMARERSLLSAETLARYGDCASKSTVPRKIRETIGPEVELLMKMKRGGRAADELQPHVTRTYDGVHTMDALNADDFTMPVYFRVPNKDGWFDLVRGQCLLFIDFRSLKIVGWSLQQDPNYSSLVIRTLCTRIFSELGVPRVLYFERGIWESSTLLKGKNTDGALPFAEASQGLREFGVGFIHAIRPRSKTVERVGGLLQDLMEGEPGYCGRLERVDLPERTKRAMYLVKARKVDPAQHFYSFEQWHDRLGQLIAHYNATPQEGRILDGFSPDQAFDAFMNPENPPIQLGPELRYLLAHHKEEREVKPSGLQFRIGKKLFRYYGPELARLVGRRVLAWFDPENPEHLVVTDLDRRNPVLVPRAEEVSALAMLTGGEDQMEAELARSAGQMAHLRARYNVIKSAVPLPYRAVLRQQAQIATGEKIERLREKAEQKQRTRDTNARLAREIGLRPPEHVLENEETQEDLRHLKNVLANHKTT